MESNRRIEFSDWGLANNFNDYIEVNENLKKYPDLLEYVIKHEEGHKKEFDLEHEFKMDIKKVIKLILFCIKYPKTLIDLSPIRKIKNILYYDINLFCLYGIILILISLLILIIKSF